ncbi:hypothetical protein NCPPB1935_00405 [Xanthomonas campestris pv. nigromaculans]|nr:hypothetical protein [Xanthomonas campestris pv. nigromaculans]CAH2706238.1 hypothetical protein NCPPB1935_00405 [Xanthomonas campestris pv. nigromaculans]
MYEGVPSLQPHQSRSIAEGFEQGVSAAPSSIAWMMLVTSYVGSLASHVGRYPRLKLLHISTKLKSLAAGSWRQFKLPVDEALSQGYAVEEAGLGCAGDSTDLILRKTEAARWYSHAMVTLCELFAEHGINATKIALVSKQTDSKSHPKCEIFV